VTTYNADQQQRSDTAANWTSANPTLRAGEWGHESNTGKVKIGDGTTAWTSLAYAGSGAGAGATKIVSVSKATAASHTLTVATDLALATEGDLVLWVGSTLNSVPDVAGPSGTGWTELIRFDTQTNEFAFAYYRFLGASPPASWTLTCTTGTTMDSLAVVLRGSMTSLFHRAGNPNSFVTPGVLGSPTGVQVCMWIAAHQGGASPAIPASDAGLLTLGGAYGTAGNRAMLVAFRNTTVEQAVPQFSNLAIGTGTAYVASAAAVFA